MPSGNKTRWKAEADSRAYVARFAKLESDGVDIEGEARTVDAMIAPRSRVLDAGCGTGRVGAALAGRGHTVTAVDLDPILVDAARQHIDLDVRLADLATLDLGEARFDAIVAAGNVLVYLEPGTERSAIERMMAHLAPGGVLVTGFATNREYSLEEFDEDLAALGLAVESRFATWDLRPMHDDADWAVTVVRAPAP